MKPAGEIWRSPALSSVKKMCNTVGMETNPELVLRIIRETEAKHGVDDIGEMFRAKHIVAARKECAYRLRNEANATLSRIADLLGLSDHTTIMYYLKEEEKRRAAESAAEPGDGQSREN